MLTLSLLNKFRAYSTQSVVFIHEIQIQPGPSCPDLGFFHLTWDLLPKFVFLAKPGVSYPTWGFLSSLRPLNTTYDFLTNLRVHAQAVMSCTTFGVLPNLGLLTLGFFEQELLVWIKGPRLGMMPWMEIKPQGE